ncbi:Calcium-binding EF-hand family protein, putative [Theobroma cacao]|uniref:Calcium-binding EF-hand family protein, putative n=1 Tax=Theobroma cacao TaxID=3641 RepID=A0A061EEC5_THECC|nr:Calcium-binding EF-hand family protein, putative [Theobroma cacao]
MFKSVCKPNVDKSCVRTTTTTKSLPILPTEEQWLSIFRRFDSDGDGLLSKQDIANAFKALGVSPPNKQTFAALSHVDENGNRYIGEDKIGELVQYVMKRGYTIKSCYFTFSLNARLCYRFGSFS